MAGSGAGANGRRRGWHLGPRAQLLLAYLRDAFWVRPAALVVAGAGLGTAAVWAETSGMPPGWASGLGYGGGAEGARGLLAALATAEIVPGRASYVARAVTPVAKVVQRMRGNGRGSVARGAGGPARRTP